MKALYKNPLAIILIVVSIAVFIYFEEHLPPLDLSHLTPGNVVAVLGYLSVIMLVVEQFIEIFIDDPDYKFKRQCKERVANINKYLEKLNTTGTLENPNFDQLIDQENPDKVIAIMKEKKELEDVLVAHELKRQRRTLMIGFILGLLLSFSGLRIMSGIVFHGPEETLSSVQATIIQAIDIILTAGIIAGGSDRIHGLIKRIKRTFQTETSR